MSADGHEAKMRVTTARWELGGCAGMGRQGMAMVTYRQLEVKVFYHIAYFSTDDPIFPYLIFLRRNCRCQSICNPPFDELRSVKREKTRDLIYFRMG